jgi:hypothetical protein
MSTYCPTSASSDPGAEVRKCAPALSFHAFRCSIDAYLTNLMVENRRAVECEAAAPGDAVTSVARSDQAE